MEAAANARRGFRHSAGANLHASNAHCPAACRALIRGVVVPEPSAELITSHAGGRLPFPTHGRHRTVFLCLLQTRVSSCTRRPQDACTHRKPRIRSDEACLRHTRSGKPCCADPSQKPALAQSVPFQLVSHLVSPCAAGDTIVLCRSSPTASEARQARPLIVNAASREGVRQADRNALVIEKAVAEMTQLRTQLRSDFARWTTQYEAGKYGRTSLARGNPGEDAEQQT